MQKVLFTLILLGSAAGCGLAAIVAAMQVKLAKIDSETHKHVAQFITKIGIVLTQGILTWRIAESQTADPTWYAWLYVIGLAVTSVGLGLQVREVIFDLVRAEETTRNSVVPPKA